MCVHLNCWFIKVLHNHILQRCMMRFIFTPFRLTYYYKTIIYFTFSILLHTVHHEYCTYKNWEVVASLIKVLILNPSPFRKTIKMEIITKPVNFKPCTLARFIVAAILIPWTNPSWHFVYTLILSSWAL